MFENLWKNIRNLIKKIKLYDIIINEILGWWQIKNYNIYFRINKINSNKIHKKFDKFYNIMNIIKLKIKNKIKTLLIEI